MDIDEHELCLRVPNLYAPLVLQLPYAILDAQATAKFDKTTRRLTVVLPLQPLSQVRVELVHMRLWYSILQGLLMTNCVHQDEVDRYLEPERRTLSPPVNLEDFAGNAA